MSKRYHYLPLSKVSAGMVLADNLLDKVGQVLLPAGVTLTDAMLRSIAHHEIHQLSVEAAPISEQEEMELRQKQLLRVEKLFRHAPATEPASLLKAYILDYRQGEIK